MKNLGLIKKENTALLVIDVQERLMAVVQDTQLIFDNVNRLIKGAEVLNVPIIVTEQYPKGLGNTCAAIELPEDTQAIEKICFSCMQSDAVVKQLKEKGITTLILCGAETHICVLKTALEAIENGLEVHVIADAVSSRTHSNKQIGLERMRHAGAFIASTEMILFQMIDEAGNDVFKIISKLII